MKRLLLILLLVVYLFSSLGVSAKSMYCMGVLRSTTISCTTNPKKDTCKIAARLKRCCQTKKQLLKVKDDRFYSGPISFLTQLFPVLFNNSSDTIATRAAIITRQQLYYSHAPPTNLKTPAYILNCNYRI